MAKYVQGAGDLTPVQAAFFQPRPAEQLFDLSTDPYEIKNLANDEDHRAKLIELRDKLTDRLKAMPDLSFFPESFLVDNVLDQPVEFGIANRERIGKLIDVANLAVESKPALDDLKSAAEDNDPICRYWAFSVCSILGDDAKPLKDLAKRAMKTDPDYMVRLRAAEFLGLVGEQDPIPTIRDICAKTDSPAEVLIALQTLVHFKDGPYQYDTTFDSSTVRVVDEQNSRRIAYLDGMSQSEFKKWQKKLRSKK